MIYLLFIAATTVVLLGDVVAARTARRFAVSYGWYVPISWALYLALGALAITRLPLVDAAILGAAVGFVDGALGSWLAYRIGVMQWKQPPTGAALVGGGLLIATMCAGLTFVGAVLMARH